MFVDFEKAFETVDWSFIWNTLGSFNFGSSLLSWIKLSYRNIERYILRWASNYFTLERGVRQGLPSVPLYFYPLCRIISQQNKRKQRYKRDFWRLKLGVSFTFKTIYTEEIRNEGLKSYYKFHTVLKPWECSNHVRKMRTTGIFARSYWFFEIVRNLDQINDYKIVFLCKFSNLSKLLQMWGAFGFLNIVSWNCYIKAVFSRRSAAALI